MGSKPETHSLEGASGSCLFYPRGLFVKVCGRDIKVEGRFIRIAHIDGDKYTFPDDPEAMLDGLRKCETRVDLFTFLQKLPETSPKYDYPMEWDNLAVLALSTFDNWWKNQLDNKTRNMVRRGEKKGVVLREVGFDGALVEGICKIYNECPIRQGKRFPLYGMSIARARAYAGTFLDRTIYIGAFLEGSMIGFLKLVTDEARSMACLVHILSLLEHRDKAPTNALIAQAVRSCTDRGIPFLVYEHFSYGKKKGDSLGRFKEANGFQQMDLPRYYIPLTSTGRVAYRLGLHRRFADHLPESVVAKLRDFRNAWHTRKFQKVTEAQERSKCLGS
jgi:hypothetical protein